MKNKMHEQQISSYDTVDSKNSLDAKECAEELSLEILRLHKIITQDHHDLSNALMAFQLQLKSHQLKGELDSETGDKLNKSLRQIIEHLETSKQNYLEGNDDLAISSETQRITLEELASDLCIYFEHSLESKKIQIKAVGKLEQELPRYSSSFLIRVLYNIVGNAIKFSPSSSAISISLSSQKSELALSIQDEGKGMPEEILKQIKDIKNLGRLNSQPGSMGEKGAGFGILSAIDFLNTLKIKWDFRVGTSSSKGFGTEFVIFLPENI